MTSASNLEMDVASTQSTTECVNLKPSHEVYPVSFRERYPVSFNLIDPLPLQPDRSQSKQRAIDNKGRKSLHTPLHVRAPAEVLGLLPDFPKSTVRSNYTLLGRRHMAGLSQAGRCKGGMEQRIPHLYTTSLSFADFRPLQAPFIPELILNMVNTIEENCHRTDWNGLFEESPCRHAKARSALISLIQLGHRAAANREFLKTLHPQTVIVALRLFLNEFSPKPLHFSRFLLRELLQKPLLDHFLRPNPNLKSTVQRCSLTQSRTQLDTLSFLMIHLHHALEYSPDPVEGKKKLCNIYGPLLISFAERPLLQHPGFYAAKTEEAAILKVVLEVCDPDFWNHMTMLRVRGAFLFQTSREEQNYVVRKEIDFSGVEKFTVKRILSIIPTSNAGNFETENKTKESDVKSNDSSKISASLIEKDLSIPSIFVSWGDTDAFKKTEDTECASLSEDPVFIMRRGLPVRKTSDLLREIHLCRGGRIKKFPTNSERQDDIRKTAEEF
ncbi:hypothetical protein CRM22_002505 [Opisthorchis felineus]|uniref:Rho-GAP domain-containing protein n=1 Tax=Opisthorchis felineus TaxID=147828 RepID=A0A4S2M5P4_OPIFE|nr:hypothetical protein CRM22_002505 [Opisthorchis felineus]